MKNLGILLAVTAALVVPAVAGAQTKPTGQKPPAANGGPAGRPGMPPGGFNSPEFQKRMAERQKERRAKLIKELKLTPDQIKKYDAHQKAMGTKRTKLFGTPGQVKMEDMRKNFEKLRAEDTAGIKKILTKDQFTKYEKFVADERKQRMQQGRQGGPGGPAGRPGGAGRPGAK